MIGNPCGAWFSRVGGALSILGARSKNFVLWCGFPLSVAVPGVVLGNPFVKHSWRKVIFKVSRGSKDWHLFPLRIEMPRLLVSSAIKI